MLTHFKEEPRWGETSVERTPATFSRSLIGPGSPPRTPRSATGLAAKLSGLDEEAEQRLASYGMKLGTAYQIYDDCLDLVGSEEVVGKTLRTDLVKGKLTLPILNLLETASESQRIKLNKRILDQEPLDLPVLLGIAEYEGAIESAVDTAIGMLADCREDLIFLGGSEYADALTQITWFLIELLEKCRR